jgi:SAM-dependent methyltransferase
VETQSDERKLREKEFHDQVFTEGGREDARRFYSVTASSRRRYLEAIVAATGRGPVLEYGCGPGSTVFYLGQRGIQAMGIDISSVAIERAQRRAARDGLEDVLSFREMDAENLEFAAGTFEVVCGRGILHHLNLEAAFREIARVLQPSGTAVFIEPLGHNPLINWYRNRTPQMRTPDEHPLLQRDLELAREFFRDVRMLPFHLSSMAAIPLRKAPGFTQLVSVLEATDRALFTMLPFLRKHAWAAVLVFSHAHSSRAGEA